MYTETPLFEEEWCYKANVVADTSTNSPAAQLFRRLTTFSLTKSFCKPFVPSPNFNLPAGETFYNEIHEWAHHHPQSLHDESDISSEELLILCMAYDRIQEVAHTSENEYSQRKGVEELIELARIRAKRQFPIRYEQILRLKNVDTDNDQKISSTATADLLITVEHDSFNRELNEADVQSGRNYSSVCTQAYWANAVASISSPFSVIAFVGEFRRAETGTGSNKNQAILDLVTAQSQRKALGLPDEVLFGAISTSGVFKVFSSAWNNKMLVIQSHSQFDLSQPIMVLQCYNFIRRLYDHIGILETQLHGLVASVVLGRWAENIWRAPSVKAKRKKGGRSAGNGSGKYNTGGSSDEDGKGGGDGPPRQRPKSETRGGNKDIKEGGGGVGGSGGKGNPESQRKRRRVGTLEVSPHVESCDELSDGEAEVWRKSMDCSQVASLHRLRELGAR